MLKKLITNIAFFTSTFLLVIALPEITLRSIYYTDMYNLCLEIAKSCYLIGGIITVVIGYKYFDLKYYSIFICYIFQIVLFSIIQDNSPFIRIFNTQGGFIDFPSWFDAIFLFLPLFIIQSITALIMHFIRRHYENTYSNY